jgi:TnpA family transposase
VFAAKAISCEIREALYVLDGLLENDTVLEPREHTTDTHGVTEQLFGLCYLLGFSFMPRFRDLADVQLYRLDRARSHGPLDPLLRSIDTAIVLEQWDALVRIASSLRDRSAPAHVVLDRLVANVSERPAKALTMLGRIVKTIHILKYLYEPTRRDRVQLQLNRGEARHLLAKKLRFADEGVFRSGDLDEIMNKVSALSVLSNAVLVWNTERISEIVERLDRSTGEPVSREDLARVSPFHRARLLVSGRYNFDRITAPE